ncbi:hypothetical protein LR48_Vigan08g007300 [Vigna angularis]|uniref:Putative plant transposon protein domain-containing protein n=1 Tax=Phaseolus angularis TaxID=3914 RepID=A0A0L9V2S2_PHAAN|nr:hypothetical protein LR48_Vigan08g007300 [Vigna angularis]
MSSALSLARQHPRIANERSGFLNMKFAWRESCKANYRIKFCYEIRTATPMAPPKSTQEKKRKTTRGSSSRSQPSETQEENLVLNYDHDRFISEAHSDRFHQEELEKRRWNFVLASLPDEIDEVLVKEFYANAWEPDHSQPHSRVSKVRGKLVRYDRRSLNRILNTLMFQPCPLGAFMSSYPDHDLIASTLCLPGYGYQLGTSGTPVRILRKHLNSLATIWSLFTFTNICPNSHTSDINLERSYMVYGIMTGIDMDVGAYISQEMALIVDNDTCKLGFPALVTTLCKASGVPGVSDITLKLQPPLNKKFFDRNCSNREEFSAMNAPPPVPPPRRNVRAARPPVAPSAPSHDIFTRYMQQSLARQDDIHDWCTTMRQDQVSLQESMYQLSLGIPDFPPDSLMIGDQFAAQIPWPEGRPESRWGSAFPGAPEPELDE